MALVFKNYKPTKEKHEELTIVKILDNGEDVFAEIPFALADFAVEYKTPVIFGNIKGIPRIMELELILKETKLFYLKEDKSKDENKQITVSEVSKEKATIITRLHKDTDVSKLFYFDGQLLTLEGKE